MSKTKIQNKNAFEMRNITKTFLNGKIVANSDVSFSAKYGEVIGLVGENGAGKSTLMSILFGLYQPDSGEILIDGKLKKITSPLNASKLGIGMVPQHFKLVGNMTVAENIMLGVEPTKYGFLLDRSSVSKRILELSKKYKLEVDPSAKINSLSIGQKQRVEILKTLFKESKIIVLDEPTSVLTPQEAKQLIEIISIFKKAGKVVVFISHKLNEIMEASDSIVVMRKGKVTGDITSKAATQQKISKMMIGESVIMEFQKPVIKKQEVAISLKDVSLKIGGVQKLKPFSLDVYKGEILALVGIDGNGQGEVAKIIAKALKPSSGQISYNNSFSQDKKASNMYLDGLGYIPGDRQKDAVAMDLSLKDNMIINRLNHFSKFGLIKRKEINNFTLEVIKKYDVQGADEGHAIFRGLSGGNQQKAVNGREIENANKLLIAAHPTRGVDVGAIKNIYKKIIEKTNKNNIPTILLTSELDEIISVANRIAVFSHGEFMGATNVNNVTREQIGLMMTGTKLENLKKKRGKNA